jgi:RimJ/RimL family protein N-acetyltransferase
MTSIETERLRLRVLDRADGAFILDLLNQPSFLQYIGDRGVRTLADACRYIEEGPATSYARHGYGLLAVVPKEVDEPAGICGIMRKDWLPDPDLAYAFLPRHWSRGYAREAAAAVVATARAAGSFPRLVAVVTPDNDPSTRLLEWLGFAFERAVVDPQGEELRLFVLPLQP